MSGIVSSIESLRERFEREALADTGERAVLLSPRQYREIVAAGGYEAWVKKLIVEATAKGGVEYD